MNQTTGEQKWTKEEWGAWKFVSEMLDNPDKDGLYPTSKCYEQIYDFVVEQKKQSLKQFIDGLIEVQNEHMQKELSVERFARPDFYKGYEASKNETITHLKKLKEELN